MHTPFRARVSRIMNKLERTMHSKQSYYSLAESVHVSIISGSARCRWWHFLTAWSNPMVHDFSCTSFPHIYVQSTAFGANMSSTLPLGCSCSHAVDIRGSKFCSYISRLRPCREDTHEETTYQLPSLACMHEQSTCTFTRNIMISAYMQKNWKEMQHA